MSIFSFKYITIYILKKIRDSRLSTLNSKIDEMIETLHMVDERVEEVLYGDDIFGRLKDEIIKI